ncbi:MAG: type III-B CRISPR-associated protein Cas10/Cmr2 [Cyanobacteria bacterium J083]|nr:MAG: type III-B CRISPR-associated protein Cas10/Cmr2 [Cyanobacteria bacterium J083]
MSYAYWQAKIWGLLHDPVLKSLHSNSGRGGNSFWKKPGVMQEWVDNHWNPETSGKKILKHIKLADYITSASDRAALGSLTNSINYNQAGIEITHLLSAKKQHLTIRDHQQLLSEGKTYLEEKENRLFEAIPAHLRGDIQADLPKTKELFWWLWRCLPEAAARELGSDNLCLMPAETRLPDASIWSHASLTAAMAGALAGYDLTTEDIEQNWQRGKPLSHPYLVSFTFSPIQELIKASRKMRDFWAGSWLLHYLSAAVCWKLAQQYGADSFIYPSLYQQPLIDHWLLQTYPEFNTWIRQPSDRSLLTAGFPNVLILVLPRDKVAAAMQTARSTLLEEWQNVSNLVFEELEARHWMRELNSQDPTWKTQLKSQWQTYWIGIPIGKEGVTLTSSELYQEDNNIPTEEEEKTAQTWQEQQNQAYDLVGEKALFVEKERVFLQKAGRLRRERYGKHPFSANVGSWWNHVFDQTRLGLAAVKNARTWQLPTAFAPRSTISGIGSVVHPPGRHKDWISEGETKAFWRRQAGLFDGIEQLNATETVKRGLHLVLPQLLQLEADKLQITYPDLTAGVAGYLKTSTETELNYFHRACQAVKQKILQENNQITNAITQAWGIPWIDQNPHPDYRKYHPRLLNPGWLVEDLDKETTKQQRESLQQLINSYYPNNNPTDWYTLAAGDGDGMGEWLQGKKLKAYYDYIPNTLKADPELQDAFSNFITLPKRMGPSTHNALSRALLDFSNQLAPYLTEERYAGRLIYSGGDDVLAYTNLWEWDNWLWDIRQCFRGDKDPQAEFTSKGDYWQWQLSETSTNLANRPLFTMGSQATISFGIIIAHHSVPLAIALENLWEAEEEAKEHKSPTGKQKDAVQVRAIYGNGNILKATVKFDVFHQWQQLLNQPVESSIFEQAATLWEQHPIPTLNAITPWTIAFCNRREQLTEEIAQQFQQQLANFIKDLWQTTEPKIRDNEIKNWLKLAAFVKRNRQINIQGK